MDHPTESVNIHGGTDAAIRLVVDQTTNDDSSTVFLHRNMMEKLCAGNYVLLKGKKGKRTVCIAKFDGSCEEPKIRMNRATRKNLCVWVGDVVSVSPFQGVEHGASVFLQPLADTIRGLTHDDLDERLKDYFMDMCRPVTEGDRFLVRGQMRCVEFKVSMTIPGESCIVGPSTMIRSKRKPLNREYENRLNEVGYDDVGGHGEQIAQINELVYLPLRRPQLLECTDLKHPRGVLLFGPAGSGKALIAQAVANENGALFLPLEGQKIMCTEAGEETMITTFAKAAAENAPSIIFIDDIDLITPKWGKTPEGVEMVVVSQLPTLMDGLKSSPQVIVIGASNRPDNIDPALKRFGRFERQISISAPDEAGRLEVLEIHTRNMWLSRDVDLKQIAKDTHGCVGSDLAALCHEAALLCIRETNEVTNLKDVSANAEILNSICISPEHFNTALKTTRGAMQQIVVGSPNVSLSDIEAPENAESKLPEAEVPTVTWQDIGGLDNVKKEIMENVQYPMENPETFEKYGLSPAKGVLLYGPPGCGKTLMAMAIAHECNVGFISIKGPEMLSKWLGESEANIRKIFDEARNSAPCIIFFDEIDSIGFERGSNPEDGGTAARILNQLLTEMDGINAQKGVFVIGATNRPEILDPALIRPGRFDNSIHIPLPDEDSRRKIFEACLRKSPLASEVNLLTLAKLTEGCSGADINEICNRAKKSAMFEERERKEARDENLDWTDEADGEDELVKINPSHFEKSIKSVGKSVTRSDLLKYEDFARNRSGSSSYNYMYI